MSSNHGHEEPHDLALSFVVENQDPSLDKIGILPRRTNVWIDDDSVDKCYQCHSSFSLWLRRHHCRGCGRVFCYDCTKYVIKASKLNATGLIQYDKYLDECLKPDKTQIQIEHRSCQDCLRIFKSVRDLSSLTGVLELLPLEITEIHNLRQVSRMWYEAGSLLLSRFREIQYHLPNHKFNDFETRVLRTNLHLAVGHNRLISQFVKSMNWSIMPEEDITYYLSLIQIQVQTCHCRTLMCSTECQLSLSDAEVIDILLHVSHPRVRAAVISYLSTNLTCIESYIPILTYCIRLDHATYEHHKITGQVEWTLRDYLINLSLGSPQILYQFYWALLVRLEEPQYNSTYRETLELLLSEVESHLGFESLKDLQNGLKLVNSFGKLSINANQLSQSLVDELIEPILDGQEIPIPIRPELKLNQINYADIKILKSATNPLKIPCQTSSQGCYSLIYKSEDIRKDQIIIGIFRIMDQILKQHGLDMEIVTYNALPTALNSGLIEVVPNSETLYYIKEKKHSSLLNYILENNSQETSEVVRQRFIKSTAAYCVMTYLLGIGDRHLDNIMVTREGRLFHIDYSHVLGYDPKPMAPKIRFTAEMLDALGGSKSHYYHQFETYYTQCYNILRRHAHLFTNLLFLLTKIEPSKFTPDQLEIMVRKRFLPGEYRAQAKIQLLKTLNSSQTSATVSDIIHYHCKENLTRDKWRTFDLGGVYKKATNLISSIPYPFMSSVTPKVPIQTIISPILSSPITLLSRVAPPVSL